MKKFVLAAIAAVAMLTGTSAQAADRVQVGVLTCDVEPGIGLVIGSSKDVECDFKRKGSKTEHYSGTINKFGFDVGFTARTKIVWLVFAATNTKYKKGSLRGTYVGGSSEFTFGVGLGTNWLIGGSRKSFALQPWSVQGQVGLNASLTFTGLTLD